MEGNTAGKLERVIGLDLGDRWSQLCVRSMASGEVLAELRVRTTQSELRKQFGDGPRSRIVLEVGTHSPWVSRCLVELGHEVIVANSRKVRLITDSRRKSDRIDARWLSRLGRADVGLLHPIEHRSAEMQAALAVVRARAALVRTRTELVLHCRGAVKSWGGRLPKCSTNGFSKRALAELPEPLRQALVPLLAEIEAMSLEIRRYDERLERLCVEQFPETLRLRQIHGVGANVALSYVLTIQSPERFRRARQVGAYVGLAAGQHDSGDSRRPGRITKEGDRALRSLLVQSAHYILGPLGRDCDLRRFGECLIARGGKGVKRKAVVAVARKLAVLLHRLWQTGETYRPFYERLSLKGRTSRKEIVLPAALAS